VDRLGLTDTVRAICGLIFDGWIPPPSVVNDVICLGQRKADACDERRKHDDTEARALTKSLQNSPSSCAASRPPRGETRLAIHDVDRRA
jgi:hypothetical protein